MNTQCANGANEKIIIKKIQILHEIIEEINYNQSTLTSVLERIGGYNIPKEDKEEAPKNVKPDTLIGALEVLIENLDYIRKISTYQYTFLNGCL